MRRRSGSFAVVLGLAGRWFLPTAAQQLPRQPLQARISPAATAEALRLPAECTDWEARATNLKGVAGGVHEDKKLWLRS